MNLVLGVTGSISAYKAVEILRIFQKNGHNVSVIMTRGAKEFISPLTFETFIPGNVYSELFKEDDTVTMYVYDKKIVLYGICFCNIELRKIWRIVQQEYIVVEINANANNKVCIALSLEE